MVEELEETDEGKDGRLPTETGWRTYSEGVRIDG